MNVYVAGRFRDYERVRALIDAISEAGHHITHDWTRTDEFDENGVPLVDTAGGGAELPVEKQREHAQADVLGVVECDAFVLFDDEEGLYGALIEAGIAMGYKKHLLVFNPARASIFWSLENVTIINDPARILTALATLESEIAPV